MTFNIQHFIKTIILGLFLWFFIDLHTSGDILKYVNPKYEYISKIAVGIFILLFVIQLFRILQPKQHIHHICSSTCNHDHGNGHFSLARLVSYGIITFPIITGFSFEPATLNASIAGNKGSFLPPVQQNNDESPDLFENANTLAEHENIDIYSEDYLPIENNNYMSNKEYEEKVKSFEASETIHMSEDMFGTYYGAINDNLSTYIGKTIKISGFVYKEEGFNANQFVVSRFMITHCLADASILGFLTEIDEAFELAEDTWVEIEGVLDVTNYGGVEIPVIKTTEWQVIDEPSEPYVYPVLTLTS
ncbi:TIGR03943 family protein [Lysinibacillus sp. BW-2-10]|uniref:TIGR03943 family putative permease subunit n=1 Tax=Lysinibacillus sp. BW-2-10 TaxID=2590030 RepID=UPI00117EEAF6|nr:TIGR03943 family protein [Lysinibacillus sp. BW-2-10]TSI04720.1 TIGR03943 family protein [Lysinibacillus sp. BW-2-10]